MNKNILTSAASRWSSPLCIAPDAPLQGSAMSMARPAFSGYPTTGALTATAPDGPLAAAKHVATTHLAVRQGADGQVPPRGRPV